MHTRYDLMQEKFANIIDEKAKISEQYLNEKALSMAQGNQSQKTV